jgi:putative transcriptional regulator
MTEIIARMRENDRRLVRVHADGREEVLQKRPIRPMAEAEIEAAAASDPDARPMTPEEAATARQIPCIKTLRRALALTQEKCAARFASPSARCGTGNRGAARPTNRPAAYLTVIARDPEGVRRALPAGAERG